MRHCPECSQRVDDEAVFCQQCGARLSHAPPTPGREDGAGLPTSSMESASGRARQRLRQARRDDRDSEEVLLWEGGFSGRAMLGSWALALLVTVASITVAATVPFEFEYRWTAVLVVVALAWGIPLMRLAYRKLSIRYRVTTQRLFHEEGILRRTTNRVELIDADDVTVEQSIFDRMMNVGTVRIESSDRTDPELFLVGIDAPLDVAEKIDAARRTERTRRGIHIETV